MDELSALKKGGLFDQLPPQQYFNMVTLGNTALTLQAELNHAIYRQYELEKDNEALRALIVALKAKVKTKA